MKTLFMNIVSMILAGSAFGLTSGNWECTKPEGDKVELGFDMENSVMHITIPPGSNAQEDARETRVEVVNLKQLKIEESPVNSNPERVADARKRFGIERYNVSQNDKGTDMLFALAAGALYIGQDYEVRDSGRDILSFHPHLSCTPK